VAISFTVEPDGRLPSGDRVQSAIEQVEHFARIRPCNGGTPHFMNTKVQICGLSALVWLG
jgi:hypothetical protein